MRTGLSLGVLVTFAAACSAFSGSADAPIEKADGGDAPDAQADGADVIPDAGPVVLPGQLAWVHAFGAAEDETVASVATSPAGEIVVVGRFTSPTLEVGCAAPLVNRGLSDGYVVKLSAAGACLWARSLAGTGQDTPYAVAVDPRNGAVVIAGGTESASLDYGTPLTTQGQAGTSDAFVLEVDSAGKPVWAHAFGVATVQELFTTVAIDASGAIAVGGQAASVTAPQLLALGPAVATARDQSDPIGVVFELAPDGTAAWGRAIEGHDYVTSLGFDNTGGIVVAGASSGTINAAKPTTYSALSNPGGATGSYDVFLMRLQRAGMGTTSWAWIRGGSGDEAAAVVAVAPDGSFQLALSISEALSLGGSVLPTVGGDDAAVGWFGAGGAHTRSISFGSAGHDLVGAIARDPDGTTYVAGAASDPLDLGSGPLPSFGQRDAYVVSLDSIGRTKLAITMGSDGLDMAHALALSQGRVIVGGTFAGTGKFGADVVPNNGKLDAFVASFGR